MLCLPQTQMVIINITHLGLSLNLRTNRNLTQSVMSAPRYYPSCEYLSKATFYEEFYHVITLQPLCKYVSAAFLLKPASWS